MTSVPCPRLSQKMTKFQQVSNSRAEENDLQFLLDVISQESCPEYNGCNNTELCREQGHSIKPKTKVVYLPLMDSSPSDPKTMMTSIMKPKKITEAGHESVVYTADQQLYRVALHLTWDNPDLCDNVFLRLGDMHFLMSYIRCIGSLMAQTGLEERLSEQFGGVNLLTGKKFPENVHALRLLLADILWPVLRKATVETMGDLKGVLENLASGSHISRLWVDCFVRPMLTVLKYVRAEREADWPPHVSAVKEMVVLFFAAGHQNYAREDRRSMH